MVERAVPGSEDWTELSAPHLARYLFATEYVTGRRVLDAGSGSGYGAHLLKIGGAQSVTGVDFDAAAVQRAREEYGTGGVDFVIDDCEQLSAVPGKLPLRPKRQRAWKKLAGLAAPTIADFPIVPPSIGRLYGTPAFHLAICRTPRLS